ncbi:MAG: hypothetical protein ABSC19_18435 [Syntrophorhabdales bacterium]|jgi:hypothetical protein
MRRGLVFLPILALMVCSCALWPIGVPEGGPAKEAPAARETAQPPRLMAALESKPIRSREETNKRCGYFYDQGTAARIEVAEVRPGKGPGGGEDLSLVLTYMVLTHSDKAVRVTETREVWRENRLLESAEVQTERAGGTYQSAVRLRLPETMELGAYKVVCIVRTPYSRDLRETGFKVNGR